MSYKTGKIDMAVSMIEKNVSNRRRASRIHERVDLFYHKVKSESEFSTPSHHEDDAEFLQQGNAKVLPKSNSQEHETLNVNISETGISYTCNEELQAGDHILLRILLLSSMTVVTVSCEVVYCRSSNPFENDRYSYLIGGRFVNIREEDTELLKQHIHKRKQQHYTLSALWALLFLAILQSPESIFDLIVGGFDFISELLVETLFIAYEILSMYMDQAVETVFHTNLHDSQTISFYLVWVLGLLAFWAVLNRLLLFLKNSLFRCKLLFFRKKSSLLYYWHDKSMLYKTSLISGVLAFISCYALFFI